uniref:Uncharacterized protein n=1 Tax=Electrophorus electricus TaxID=8005 RepID=A0AAY5EMR7_ELEEL
MIKFILSTLFLSLLHDEEKESNREKEREREQQREKKTKLWAGITSVYATMSQYEQLIALPHSSTQSL